MTVRARDFGSYVWLVAEPDVVRQIMYAYPGNRFLVLPKLKNLEDLGFLVEHDFVTASTALH